VLDEPELLEEEVVPEVEGCVEGVEAAPEGEDWGADGWLVSWGSAMMRPAKARTTTTGTAPSSSGRVLSADIIFTVSTAPEIIGLEAFRRQQTLFSTS
jgi:hypothetical protein